LGGGAWGWSCYRGLAVSSFMLAVVYLEGAECSAV